MPIRHVFWDFDGTLADTYTLLTQEFLKALSRLAPDFQPDWEDAYRELKVTVGHACRVFAAKAALSPDVLSAAFAEEHARETLKPENLYPGTESCLEASQKAGCIHYLFTNRDSRAADALESCGILSYFPVLLTRDSGYALKPEPDALVAAVEQYHFLPEEAVMIGDRDIDLISARRAGIRGILFDPDDFYPQEPADWRVSDMKQLEKLLLSLSEENA